MGFAWKTIVRNCFWGFVASLLNARKNGMFCEKVTWQICEKWKKLARMVILWIYLKSIPFITSCHYLVHPINEFSKPNYFDPFPYQPTWIRKGTITLHISLFVQIFFKYLFKMFTSFTIVVITLSRTLWKLPFQSEVKSME